MIWTLSQVALGGAIGATLRFGVTTATARAFTGSFPIGTLAVNVAGSLVMGLLFVLLTTRTHLHPFLLTGILGGFTTFSAFSLDAVTLWERGQANEAALYVAASVILSIAALIAGAAIARSFT
jgi:fluoride exporter